MCLLLHCKVLDNHMHADYYCPWFPLALQDSASRALALLRQKMRSEQSEAMPEAVPAGTIIKRLKNKLQVPPFARALCNASRCCEHCALCGASGKQSSHVHACPCNLLYYRPENHFLVCSAWQENVLA